MVDPSGMGVAFSWKTDLLSGYEHEFLPESSGIATTKFSDVDNPSITTYLNEFCPDVVLLHGYAHKTLLRALYWCRCRDIPLMMISDRSFSGVTTPIRRLARRIVLPKLLRQFDAFLVIGDAIQKFYESFGARRESIFRVPNMLDEGFWRLRDRKQDERLRIRHNLGIRDEFVVLYVGKLIRRKRPQDLLAALAILQRRLKTHRVRVVFVGDGEMRAELETTASNASLPVHFLGFVNIDELPRYYCAADVLAHPAENESYGIVTLEAAVFGLPLILSDRVGAIGPTSIARPGENTLVHVCKDVAALADAIERLANEPETWARMSRASERFAQDHDGGLSVSNTLAAMRSCLKSRKATNKSAAAGAGS
jgi:glycosyltransferase involved in cell wall biosynthesis